MNRLVFVKAKSKKHADELIEDLYNAKPHIELRLGKLRSNGYGFSAEAKAYRRLLASLNEWRHDEQT